MRRRNSAHQRSSAGASGAGGVRRARTSIEVHRALGRVDARSRTRQIIIRRDWKCTVPPIGEQRGPDATSTSYYDRAAYRNTSAYAVYPPRLLGGVVEDAACAASRSCIMTWPPRRQAPAAHQRSSGFRFGNATSSAFASAASRACRSRASRSSLRRAAAPLARQLGTFRRGCQRSSAQASITGIASAKTARAAEHPLSAPGSFSRSASDAEPVRCCRRSNVRAEHVVDGGRSRAGVGAALYLQPLVTRSRRSRQAPSPARARTPRARAFFHPRRVALVTRRCRRREPPRAPSPPPAAAFDRNVPMAC